MSIRGHAEDGVSILDDAVQLADGTLVLIEIAVGPPGLSTSPQLQVEEHPKGWELMSPEIQRLTGILPSESDVETMMHELERFSGE